MTKHYREGDTDSSIVGQAIMWEDGSNVLRSVSAAKPLPTSDAVTGGALGTTADAPASAVADEDTTARTGISLWKGIKNLLIDLTGLLGGTLTVDATGQGDVPITLDSEAVVLGAGSSVIGKTQPFAALLEGGLTELVGADEQVDQDDYGGSVGVALGGTYSGEILSFAFYATEDGTGAVQDSAGRLIILDADPSVSAGDTALAAAEWVTILGIVQVEADDWITDANGGAAYIHDTPVPFHALSTLYFVWFHEDATSLNDGAGDDEVLRVNFWYRRDS